MKKRIICFALILVMLAGCAAAPGNDGKQEEVEQLLETGYYALREDEDGEPTGYLRVQSRQIIWYDADGNEIAKKNYEFNEEDGTYEVTKGEDFKVEKQKKKLYYVNEDEEKFLLTSIGAA